MNSNSIPSADDVKKEIANVEREIKEGDIDTKDTGFRYLAYLARLRPLVQPATRYLAYTSDVGEAFRPVVNPRIVTTAYGVSWAYLIGDVAYEGYKSGKEVKDCNIEGKEGTTAIGLRVVQRSIFQATASMLFPALTIHSIVKYSALFLQKRKVQSRFMKAMPTALGLFTVPFLPYIFDGMLSSLLVTVHDVI